MFCWVPDGKGLEGWVKKVKGLRSTNWSLQNSHGEVKYNIGNTALSMSQCCEDCLIEWVGLGEGDKGGKLGQL